ncbi:MAG TPA: ABC transporter permease [Streptosporangiaceae bacterium]|jgi:ABC-2 type transport system permease protein
MNARANAAAAAGRLPARLRVLAAQVGYQLRLLTRSPRALIAGLVMPGVLLALRLGRIHHASTGAAAMQLAAVEAGLVTFGLLGTAYVTHASGLVSAREDGVLRRWRATPLPAGGYFLGRITATVLLADASAVVLVLTAVAMAGTHLTAGMMAALLVASTIGGLTLASVATAVTIMIPTSQAANPVLMLSYLPLIIFSGGFGSVAGLPSALTTLMEYLPARPLIDILTSAMRHGSLTTVATGRDLAVLGGWAVAGLLASVRFFRWDPDRPGRRARRASPLPAPGPAAG